MRSTLWKQMKKENLAVDQLTPILTGSVEDPYVPDPTYIKFYCHQPEQFYIILDDKIAWIAAF